MGIMHSEALIRDLKDLISTEFQSDSSGHDWFHIERVLKNAKVIQEKEGGDRLLVELGALMHDIADHKFVANAEVEEEKRIQTILAQLNVTQDQIDRVKEIVASVSFKGGKGVSPKSIEAKIVQDADRLDAIGAIGIARTFAFGGKFGSVMYDPDIKPSEFESVEEYRKKRSHTINHFYEKLLLLKDLMNTPTAKELAEKRHLFMEQFLTQFYAEWSGEL